MNRREFLKFSALTGLAAVIPVDIVFDLRDDETRFLDALITRESDEFIVARQIKQYLYCKCFDGSYPGQKQLIPAMREFIERQPNIMTWLKTRIDIYNKESESGKRWAIFKNTVDVQFELEETLKYDAYAAEFNLPRVSPARIEACKKNMEEFPMTVGRAKRWMKT